MPRESVIAAVTLIRKQIIERSKRSHVRVDLSFPRYRSDDLDGVMKQVVEIETARASCEGGRARTEKVDGKWKLKGLRLFGSGQEWH